MVTKKIFRVVLIWFPIRHVAAVNSGASIKTEPGVDSFANVVFENE